MTARKNISAPDPVESDEPDAIESEIPPPPRRPRADGSRRVSVVTREEYIAPPPAAATVDAEEDDEPDAPAAPVEELPPVTRSPLDNLLAELSSDLSGLSIYVIRKEDTGTTGLTFRNPCLKQRTAGSLDFREQFSNPMQIDLAVQRRWGGGEYQLQVRRGGTYLQAWSTVIEDLPLGQNPVGPDAPISGYNGAVPVTPTFEDQLERFARVSKILGLTNDRNHPPPEPVDPLAQAQSMVGMMQGFVELGKSMAPPAPVVSTKGSTLETLLNAGVAILGTPQGQQIAGGITQFLGAAAMRIVSPPAPAAVASNGGNPTVREGAQLPAQPVSGRGAPGGIAEAQAAETTSPAPPDLNDPAQREYVLTSARQTLAWRIATAIELNRHHGETVQFVLDMLAQFPPLADTLRDELRVSMTVDPAVLLQQLSFMVTNLQQRPCDLTVIETATGWLESFREDLLDEPQFLVGAGSQEPGAGEESAPEPVFNMDPDAAVGAGSQVVGAGEEVASQPTESVPPAIAGGLDDE